MESVLVRSGTSLPAIRPLLLHLGRRRPSLAGDERRRGSAALTMNAPTDSHELDRAPEPRRVDCSVLVPDTQRGAEHRDQRSRDAQAAVPGPTRVPARGWWLNDGTPELLRALAGTDARIRLLENPGGITPGSLNVALAHARGRWVARMDAHTEYPDEYLARGVERLAQGGTRWVSGPQVATGHDRVSRAVALALSHPARLRRIA